MALAMAAGLTALVSLPFLPSRVRIELPLRADPAFEGRRPSDEDLVARIEALALAGEVEVVLQGGGVRLVLGQLADADVSLDVVRRELERVGYLAGAEERIPEIRIDALISADPRLLPLMLSVQSVVFLAITFLLRGLAPAIDDALVLAGSALGLRLELGPEATPAHLAGPLGTLAVGALGGLGALAANFVIGRLLDVLGLPVTEQDWIVRILSDREVVLGLAPFLIVVGPLAEEAFFRGYVYRRLRRLAGLPTALLVSSIAFAAIHWNVSGFLVYVALGVVFALAYERSGRLAAPIVSHMLLNATVVAAGVWGGDLERAVSGGLVATVLTLPFRLGAPGSPPGF